MTDPSRLLDGLTELSEEERSLLEAGQAMAPPEALSASLWAGVAAKLPPAAMKASGASGSTAGSGLSGAGAANGSSLLLVKAALVAGALGGLVLGGRAWLRAHEAHEAPRENVPSVTAPTLVPAPIASVVEASSPLPAPSAVPAAAGTSTLHAPSSVHAVRVSDRTPAPAASSDAREESRVVTMARTALRGGDSAGALNLLAEARQRFGNGVLGQEREALLIEALAKSGQMSAARAHGQAFLKNYSNSPYAARVKQVAGLE